MLHILLSQTSTYIKTIARVSMQLKRSQEFILFSTLQDGQVQHVGKKKYKTCLNFILSHI
jgi:hypothetical protein